MGFICPDCHKDFGRNKEWFDDHLKAHKYDRNEHPLMLFATRYKQNTDLRAIQNAVKSNKIRIWIDYDGNITLHSMETHNEIKFQPFYNFDGELCEENPLCQKYGKCPSYEGIK